MNSVLMWFRTKRTHVRSETTIWIQKCTHKGQTNKKLGQHDFDFNFRHLKTSANPLSYYSFLVKATLCCGWMFQQIYRRISCIDLLQYHSRYDDIFLILTHVEVTWEVYMLSDSLPSIKYWTNFVMLIVSLIPLTFMTVMSLLLLYTRVIVLYTRAIVPY